MKVLVISPTFPNCICGVGDYSYILSRELKKKGNDVYVITSEKPEIREDLEEIIILKIIKNWKIKNLIEIIKKIREINPEIIYFQFVQYLYNRYGITLNLLFLLLVNKIYLRRKCIIIFHELYMKWDAHPLKFLLAIYHRLQAFMLFFLSDASIVTSEKRLNHIRKFYPTRKKIHYVPIFSNIPFLELSPAEKKALKSKLGIEKATIIGSFGKLDYIDKDLKTVFLAISDLIHNKKIDVRLLLIGGFKDENSEKKKEFYNLIKKLEIEKLVNFIGVIPQDEVSKFLQLMDIYISPILDGPTTRRTTLMAALENSLPVIAFSGVENANIFKDEENLILCKPDTTELSDKIELLINNTQLRESIKNNATKLYMENFTPTIVTDKLLSIGINLLQKQQKS